VTVCSDDIATFGAVFAFSCCSFLSRCVIGLLVLVPVAAVVVFPLGLYCTLFGLIDTSCASYSF
jgi:hypothetical protein